MKQYKLVICDGEEDFSLGLMNYINRDEGNPFMAVAFSKWDKFTAYLANHTIHCLVANCRFQREFQTAVPVLWLSETQIGEQKDTIYKYQSMEVLMVRLNRLLLEHGSLQTSSSEQQIYGVYSPVGRSGKTSFALALCTHLNKRGRSLYLGFEEYSSFTSGQKEMSDLLYLIKSRSPDILSQLTICLQHRGQQELLPSPAAYMDIRQLTLEDMTWFVQQLSQYTALVFDIGAGSFGDIGILRLMNRIFMPVLTQGGREKEQNFRQMLALMDLSYLEERMVPVHLEDACRSGDIMEELVEQLVG